MMSIKYQGKLQVEKREIDNVTLSYLRFQTPKENKGNIICFLTLFLYFIGLFPIIGETFSLTFFLAAFIPTVLISVWAIIYLIDPYRFEKSYYLFFGIYGVVNTYVYFLSIVKLLYIDMKVEGIIPLILSLLLFIILLVGVNLLNLKALYSGTYHKLQNMRSINVAWVSIGALGYILGQFLLSFIYTDSALYTLIIVLISLLSCVTAYFTVYIHRYYFNDKNMELVKQVYPDFGLPMSERNTKSRRKKKKKKM
ncbi:hypothetical protein KD050_15755 [Psychrobacillus sp. INOP01]|uniref:hypothetical protein n=1 Tax=Psychrobacillus sp. INOP01 TaxID=2829187 RepID=UPI001BAB8C20|nr:hypothetical protein [Psychrobacillus sp. INOP01]QUG40736.1 hypothetical protein KD050_15755 [Psychrobacillus sp. INOP01]